MSTQLLLHSPWVKFDASRKTGRRRQLIRSLLLPVTGDGQKETSSPFKEELICAFTKHSMASLSQLQRNCSQGSPDSGNKTKIQTRYYWNMFSTSCFFFPVTFVSTFISVSSFVLCFFTLNAFKFHSSKQFVFEKPSNVAWHSWLQTSCLCWGFAVSSFSRENLIQLIPSLTAHRLRYNIPPDLQKP